MAATHVFKMRSRVAVKRGSAAERSQWSAGWCRDSRYTRTRSEEDERHDEDRRVEDVVVLVRLCEELVLGAVGELTGSGGSRQFAARKRLTSNPCSGFLRVACRER
jgi:hypothetical protein